MVFVAVDCSFLIGNAHGPSHNLQGIERQAPFNNKDVAQMHELLRSSNSYEDLNVDESVCVAGLLFFALP